MNLNRQFCTLIIVFFFFRIDFLKSHEYINILYRLHYTYSRMILNINGNSMALNLSSSFMYSHYKLYDSLDFFIFYDALSKFVY